MHRRVFKLFPFLLLPATWGCGVSDAAYNKIQSWTSGVNADSMGAQPTDVHQIPTREPKDLIENSAIVMSTAQPDIVFTINDSGNEPVLFALDTLGTARGRWNVSNASNGDWEAATRGQCLDSASAASGSTAPASPQGATLAATVSGSCLFIGDVGDNGAARKTVKIYQVAEPRVSAATAMDTGTIAARKLVMKYPDTPHDVEAMYIGPDGTIFLITKRPLKHLDGTLREALVFAIPPAAWTMPDTVTAALVDSLPIVPGSSELRRITDASLSNDSHFLAVRTYGQVYTFVADSSTGRALHNTAPAVCNVEGIEAIQGEGIAWYGASRRLLLSNERRNAPMSRITCPLPAR